MVDIGTSCSLCVYSPFQIWVTPFKNNCFMCSVNVVFERRVFLLRFLGRAVWCVLLSLPGKNADITAHLNIHLDVLARSQMTEYIKISISFLS